MAEGPLQGRTADVERNKALPTAKMSWNAVQSASHGMQPRPIAKIAKQVAAT